MRKPTVSQRHAMLLMLMLLVAWSAAPVACVKPVFDLANNMRLVLLPSDTKMGTVVYKLRASDADEDYPLTFRAFGDETSFPTTPITSTYTAIQYLC